jgi:hypothetical protein
VNINGVLVTVTLPKLSFFAKSREISSECIFQGKKAVLCKEGELKTEFGCITSRANDPESNEPSLKVDTVHEADPEVPLNALLRRLEVSVKQVI